MLVHPLLLHPLLVHSLLVILPALPLTALGPRVKKTYRAACTGRAASSDMIDGAGEEGSPWPWGFVSPRMSRLSFTVWEVLLVGWFEVWAQHLALGRGGRVPTFTPNKETYRETRLGWSAVSSHISLVPTFYPHKETYRDGAPLRLCTLRRMGFGLARVSALCALLAPSVVRALSPAAARPRVITDVIHRSITLHPLCVAVADRGHRAPNPNLHR